jgi:hypothetical protein
MDAIEKENLFAQLRDVECALSPENLWMDGEASARLNQIKRGIIAQLGYEPTIKELFNYALHSIGRKAGDYPDFTFWRKRQSSKIVASEPATSKKNVTIVEFTYNWKSRRVQLISLDSQYLIGLEITREGSRYNYQFKKYLRYKIDNGLIRLYHFGEPLTNS